MSVKLLDDLIPIDDGLHNGNGLKGQRVYCIVFNRENLEILAATDTHNDASQKATELYNELNLDAVPGEVRFYDEDITPDSIIGMKLYQFQHFVNENPNHPLVSDYVEVETQYKPLTP